MAPSLAIVAGAAVLCWPAFLSGFPLLFPDSVNYLHDGRPILSALFGSQAELSGWMRSPLYSLVAYLVHWGRDPWPVIVTQALVTAWTLWLVVRSLGLRRPVPPYLGLVGFLSLFTGLGWVVSWILPDILGPALYLGIYLLVFARDTLSRTEAGLVAGLIVGSITSHVTHGMLAVTCGALLGVALLAWPAVMRPRARSVGLVALLVATALAIQVGLNAYLTGEPSLHGRRPPFLMARLVADGPARQVLRERCDRLPWVICDFVDRLPTDSNEFLWGAGNVMASVKPEQAERLRREELPLLGATLRDYPGEQLRVSLGNFGRQLVTFDLDGFRNNPWAAHALQIAMPAAGASYQRSRQSRNALPTGFFSRLQSGTILVAIVLVATMLPWCWRRGETRLLGLTTIVLPMLVANALYTGVLSLVDSRYQLRIVWLLPFLAGLMVARYREERRGVRSATRGPASGARGGRAVRRDDPHRSTIPPLLGDRADGRSTPWRRRSQGQRRAAYHDALDASPALALGQGRTARVPGARWAAPTQPGDRWPGRHAGGLGRLPP